MKILVSLCMGLLSTSVFAASENPELVVKSADSTTVYTVSDLLKSKNQHPLKLQEDSHYQKNTVTYSVVPVKTLFRGLNVPKDATIQFTATDGFSGIIKAERLFDEDKNHSHAYLAFHLPKKDQSLGPFYLVWENPEASHISTEEWPYALASLEVKTANEVGYLKMQPDPKLPADDPIRKGQAIFTKNCFSCHTLNHEGTSHVGPDLNLPYNPLEYFKEGFFEKYVRNIQDVHSFPQAKMNAFPKESITDEELKDLRAYLEHMSKRKLP